MQRTLPDPNHHLYDARDFILNSRLAQKAYQSDWPGVALAVPVLIDAIHRLAQSCHMPEFTDHGLPHVCSLVDRVSQWTIEDGSFLTNKLSANEAAVLLWATLAHDIAMLSQSPEDLPDDSDSYYQISRWTDIATWARKTHVLRIEKLVQRLICDLSTNFQETYKEFVGNNLFQTAIQVAKSHHYWPWEWEEKCGIKKLSEQETEPNVLGLAAILAIVDLLDEDSARCDTATLLKHKQGTILNRAHWIRHTLTNGRLMINQGKISVQMSKPEGELQVLKPVYGALRNHYRLVLLYESSLNSWEDFKASVSIAALEPATGIPNQKNDLEHWQDFPGFESENALAFQLLNTFMPEALKDSRRLSQNTINFLKPAGLEDIDLSIFEEVEGKEIQSSVEKTFHALLADSNEEATRTAWVFIQKQVDEAHIQNDGLQIRLLLEIAWIYILCKKEVSLEFNEVFWFFVMAVYWKFDYSSYNDFPNQLKEKWSEYKCENDWVTRVIVILDTAMQQQIKPFDTLAEDTVKGLFSSDLFSEENKYLTQILSLIIEKQWLRADGQGYVHESLESWISQCGNLPTVKNDFEKLNNRLQHQQSLLFHAKKPFPEKNNQKEENLHWSEKIYFALLNRQWDVLESEMDKQNNTITSNKELVIASDSPEIGIWNHLALVSEYHSPGQHRSIAKNRSILWLRNLVAKKNTKVYQYMYHLNDTYQEHIEKNHATGTVVYSTDPALLAFATAQTMQLIALRNWDFLEYKDASTKCANALLRIVIADKDTFDQAKKLECAQLACGAIQFYMRGFSNFDVKKKPELRLLFDFFDFADDKSRCEIVREILNSPKSERIRLEKVFELMDDSVPDSMLNEVMDWYIQLESIPPGNRNGKTTHLDTIGGILRNTRNTSVFIKRLIPFFEKCNHLDLAKKFIVLTLNHGTDEQVQKIGTVILERSQNNTDHPLAYLDIILEICALKPFMTDVFDDWISPQSQNDPQLRLNWQKIKTGEFDSLPENKELLANICSQVLESLDNVNSGYAVYYHHDLCGSFAWPDENALPLLDKIEAGIHSGEYYPSMIRSLLATVRLIYAGSFPQGKTKIQQMVLKLLETWPLQTRPENKFMLIFGVTDDMLIYPLMKIIEDIIDEQQECLVELNTKINEKLYLFLENPHIDAIVPVLVKLALSKNNLVTEESAKHYVSVIKILFSIAFSRKERSNADCFIVAKMINAFASLFFIQRQEVFSLKFSGASAIRKEILNLLEGLFLRTAESISCAERATTANVLSCWKAMSDSLTDEESEIRQLLMFPEKMNTLLEKLQSDNRRSVAASANHSIKGFN